MTTPTRAALPAPMPCAETDPATCRVSNTRYTVYQAPPRLRRATVLVTACCLVVAGLHDTAAAQGEAWLQASVDVRHDVTQTLIGSPPRVNVLVVEGIRDGRAQRQPPVAVDIRYDVQQTAVGVPPNVNVRIVEDVKADRINRMPAANVLIVEDVTSDRINRMPPVDVDLRHGVEEWFIGQPEAVAVSITYSPSTERDGETADQGDAATLAAQAGEGAAGLRRRPRPSFVHWFYRPSPWATPIWTYQQPDDTYHPRLPELYKRPDFTYEPTRSWRYIPRRDFRWTPWVWRRY